MDWPSLHVGLCLLVVDGMICVPEGFLRSILAERWIFFCICRCVGLSQALTFSEIVGRERGL